MGGRRTGFHVETVAVHAGREIDPASGAVAPSVQLSTTYQRDADGQYRRGYDYTRSGNPNRQLLERAIAALEDAPVAAAFSSGSAAVLAVLQTAGAGGHIVATQDCYHGTLQQFAALLPGMGMSVTLVDSTRIDAVAAAVREETRLIWVETPSNPLMRISDIESISQLAKDRGCMLACDNTFATPVFQHPLALGADYSIHSTTKYLGGHSDVLGGAVAAARDDEHFQKIRRWQTSGGAVPGAFDCWLLLRSLNTLPLRVRQQSASAMKLAERLTGHPLIARALYPGLPEHPGHDVATRQMAADGEPRFGGMLSFEMAAGAEAAMAVAASTDIFIRATSLGGVESLIEHRASAEGPGTWAPPGLLRLSIGVEHYADLEADLLQALEKSRQHPG